MCIFYDYIGVLSDIPSAFKHCKKALVKKENNNFFLKHPRQTILA